MSTGEIILVIGGARSGKSALAEKLAAALGDEVTYVATAGIHDEEMAVRVRRHRERRPEGWKTVEETHNLANVLRSTPAGSVILIDCLTLWVTNLLLDESVPKPGATGEEKEKYILDEVRDILGVARNNKHIVILVSNEVGYGLVPDNQLGRLFRDITGRVNQCIARVADRVFLVTAGIPLEIKSLAFSLTQEGI
ncbi:bifunctional adenosylcobinamide kinase/adenosylcobinamide-phosphate guanylyltransferase [Desulfallas sp. Bu1-1]|jgi:adenosylcobinamide kinase/adenosylcobinamide-phosphate guanylyltransferase|uniref:bifunctional adenosylcobinamide kinase/adenosylcobinamide-phosphate guanylyltransferase n=1 Tax=Desulfallas sp. Bu1-1 TaxID=2787620 RepID=UPI00189EED8D|nr:bifunctional adenosylcobinamide kinase/adenosylcobinamide-phosphate guanylyltransferase [Desulfallas sp. Bu1-1]MBF7083057.1 bifunctional adenosylcobinamide kinase/adenosylcobinamide-phosphate guanylyltransferase [Desulfallas sp. Bu1-1]